jgi:hypothetical protein
MAEGMFGNLVKAVSLMSPDELGLSPSSQAVP